MKKFRIAALMMCFVAVSMVFASCAKNEDLIVGKWKCTKIVDGDRTTTYGDSEGYIYEYLADNTVKMYMVGLEAYGVTGTYSIDGDVLTISIASQPQKSNIDKLTKSKMILSNPDNPSEIAEFDKM